MPAPVPAFVTVSVWVLLVKFAVTVIGPVTLTVQVPVPEQPPPDQPVKFDVESPDAVKVTEVFVLYVSAQSEPQLIPVPVTSPPPDPPFAIESVRAAVRLKVAVTVVGALIGTMQVPVPEQPPPDHPAKVEPELAAAVSVTEVPGVYASEQSEPQLIFVAVTVPVPAPAFVTVIRRGVVGIVKGGVSSEKSLSFPAVSNAVTAKIYVLLGRKTLSGRTYSTA